MADDVAPPDTSRVVFMPSGRRAEVAAGTTLLDAARLLGVDLASVCGGRALCGRCQVIVPEGEIPTQEVTDNQAGVSPFSEPEAAYAAKRGLDDGRRLGCHARVLGPLVVDVPADSQIHRQVIRKRAEVRDFELDPVVTLHYVEVDPPDLGSASGDLARLKNALKGEWDLDITAVDHDVLSELQEALRAGSWKVTAAVHDGATLTRIWPGFHDALYGIALDIGSTTIAGHLMDLQTGATLASEGLMNPQIRFGEDLMSRVSYAMLNEGGSAALTEAVREAINHLISSLAEAAEVAQDDVLELVVVGNPIMHHLFLGLDPVQLGVAPFALATDEAVRMPLVDVGISAGRGSRLYVLPCIAGHVGADAAGVVLSEEPHLEDKVTLLVDVGTNAEIVLGNHDRLLAASSPTGPAFEGAQIGAGQRAATGAIERVRIDRETLAAKVKVIGTEAWSDQPEFEGTTVTGICGSGIIEAIAEMFLAGIVTSDGVVDGSLAATCDAVRPSGRTFSYSVYPAEPGIVVTQEDVRAIQLAKAALHAGCRLLMDHLGVEQVDRIRLAGAFGSVIDPVHALILGLVPDCDVPEVTAAGNAAASGAQMALLSGKARESIEVLAKRIEKIETATEPSFQEHFVAAMGIPHTTDPYVRLGTEVELPEPRRSSSTRRSRRRNTPAIDLSDGGSDG